MINRYELSSPKLQEEIFIEYTDGLLSAIVLPIKEPLSDKAFGTLWIQLQAARKETDIAKIADIGLTVAKEIPKNVKLAMFCEKYLQHKNEKFSATGTDCKKLEPSSIKITYELLDHYFTTSNFLFAGKHSVFNLTKYYNELKVDFNNKGKKQYPDYYSKEYADKLQPSQLTDYWKHLTAKGLMPVKNGIGALMDWVKKV